MKLAFPTPVPRGALLAMLFTVGIFWGITFALARAGGEGGIQTLGYSFWFHFGGGMGLLLLGLSQRSRVAFDRKLALYTLIGGLSVNALPSFFMFTSVRHIPTGVMAVIITLGPVITYAASLALRYERFLATRALGTLLGLAGVAVILLPRTSLPDPALIWWVVFALFCPTIHGSRSRLCATGYLKSCSMTASIVSMISVIAYASRSAIQYVLPLAASTFSHSSRPWQMLSTYAIDRRLLPGPTSGPLPFFTMPKNSD